MVCTQLSPFSSRGMITSSSWDIGMYKCLVFELLELPEQVLHSWDKPIGRRSVSSYCWGRLYCSFTASFSSAMQVIVASVLACDDGGLHTNFCHIGHGHMTSSGSWDNWSSSRSVLYFISSIANFLNTGYLSLWWSIFLNNIPDHSWRDIFPSSCTRGTCVPFPISSLERDPNCLSSVPTTSRLLFPLSQYWSNQVTIYSPGW